MCVRKKESIKIMSQKPPSAERTGRKIEGKKGTCKDLDKRQD